MLKPLVDISTFVGVQSLYWGSPWDPWAPELAGKLADLYVYSDKLRYVSPMPSGVDPYDYPGKPELLSELQAGHPGILVPEVFETDNLPYLNKKHILGTFEYFRWWAQANPRKLHFWSALHRNEWVREGFSSRAARKHVFDTEFLYKTYGLQELVSLANSLGVEDVSLLLYTYDVVLRLPLYGALAGQDSYYLNHPIRRAIQLPGSQYEPAPLPPICISFEKTITRMAKELAPKQYVRILQELREAVWGAGLHKLPPGQVEVEVVRDIAHKVKLTPYLKHFSKSAGVIGGVVGGLGAIVALGPVSSLLGGAVAVAAEIWDGELPSAAAGAKWLQWALKWEFEKQIHEAPDW